MCLDKADMAEPGIWGAVGVGEFEQGGSSVFHLRSSS